MVLSFPGITMSKVKMQEILLDFVVKAHIRLHSPLQSIDQHKYMVKDCKLLNEALQTKKNVMCTSTLWISLQMKKQ